MLQLSSITFTNYKAFKEKQTFDIKPVNIIVGKNSSGKSALARLPLLLARALSSEARAPLEFKFENHEFGGSFKDLIFNKFEHGSIEFELFFTNPTPEEDEEDEEDCKCKFIIQHVAGSPLQLIKYWEYESKNFKQKFELDFDVVDLKSPLKYSTYSCTGAFNGKGKIQFKGLRPWAIRLDKASITEESINNEKLLSKRMFEIGFACTSMEYIGPFRADTDRNYSSGGSVDIEIGSKGERAPEMLAMDEFISGGQIKSNVSDWFKEYLGGWGLDIKIKEEGYSIELISPDDPNIKINIKDAGHGMSQVLPIIVQSFSQSFSNLIIIEQPELHLHPAAHGDLGELMIKSAIENEKNIIIETHSENLLLRARRLIADGTLKNTDVAIYWVNDLDRPGSNLKLIEISEEGDLLNWPEGVFSEDYEEVLAIRKAQKNKGNVA